MEFIAPPNDSDNRSEAVSVDSGGSVFSTGDARGCGAGGGGSTFFVGCASAAFFVGAGAGLGAAVGIAGKEINATSMARKGRSFTV